MNKPPLTSTHWTQNEQTTSYLNPLNTKWTNHLLPQPIEHKKSTTYGIWTPGSGLEQVQKCDEVKSI